MNKEKQYQSDKNGATLAAMPLEVGRAYNYYLKGLTAKEIGKLLDISQRTVQRWSAQYDFEGLAGVPELETIPQKAVRMAAAGLSYTEIGKKLRRCKATIYNYVKATKQTNLENAG